MVGIEYNDGDVIITLVAGDDEDCDAYIGTDADDHTAGRKLWNYGIIDSLSFACFLVPQSREGLERKSDFLLQSAERAAFEACVAACAGCLCCSLFSNSPPMRYITCL